MKLGAASIGTVIGRQAFVVEDGQEKGVILMEVAALDDEPKRSLFATACTRLELGSPRISPVLPYLVAFDPLTW